MHILIADDHDLVRESLRAHVHLLATDIRISEAATLPEVMDMARSEARIDLILLDLNMPGMDHPTGSGIAGLQSVFLAFPEVPIVVVSGHFNASVIAAAMRNGAKGFVPKTTAGKDLIGALRCVLAGEVYVPKIPAADLVAQRESYPLSTAEVPDHPLRRVSPREATVLQLLIQGKTNKEIALHLGLKEITVKVHLQHAYRKIGAANRADAVRIVLRGGSGEIVREAG